MCQRASMVSLQRWPGLVTRSARSRLEPNGFDGNEMGPTCGPCPLRELPSWSRFKIPLKNGLRAVMERAADIARRPELRRCISRNGRHRSGRAGGNWRNPPVRKNNGCRWQSTVGTASDAAAGIQAQGISGATAERSGFSLSSLSTSSRLCRLVRCPEIAVSRRPGPGCATKKRAGGS